MLTLTEQFFQEGEAKGRAAGVAEGRVKALSRQLERRFGPLSPAARSRLAAASARELDEWTDRVLDAPTLGEVFGNRIEQSYDGENHESG